MLTTGLTLTAPALFLAGLTTSLHCTLMCASLNLMQTGSRARIPLAHALILLHGGRVLGYALLGAIAGTLGSQLLARLPDDRLGTMVLMASALALIAAGIVQLRDAAHDPHRCSANHPSLNKGWPPRVRLLAQGLLWSLMPCGILYAVLVLAAVSGSGRSGALLLAAFGLGTVPLMALSGGALAISLHRLRGGRRIRRVAAGLLIATGTLSAIALVSEPSWFHHVWCGTNPDLYQLR